jgi:hypothetical protein
MGECLPSSAYINSILMGATTPILLENVHPLSVETRAHLVDLQRAVPEECRGFEATAGADRSGRNLGAASVFASFLVVFVAA